MKTNHTKDEPTANYAKTETTLVLCTACQQMTKHIETTCLKCGFAETVQVGVQDQLTPDLVSIDDTKRTKIEHMTPDKVEDLSEVYKKIDEYYRQNFDASQPEKKMYISELIDYYFTQHHQDMLREIEQIDFYGWDENTQRMIKEKIIKSVSK